MIDATLRIKNLSIALEALSRINNEGSPDLYDKIESLIRHEIKEQKEENKRQLTNEPSTDDDF